MLRDLEARVAARGRAAGLVIQPDDNAILVTRYLDRSWQYRRLLMRMPRDSPEHLDRLLDAMAGLLVELHRNGVFWGDCSLANTLFSRDGQVLQAWLVDAETSEIHPRLSNGQRQHDLDILVENVAGGLLDLAIRMEQPEDDYPELFEPGGERGDPLPGAVGRAARRVGLRRRRPVRGREPDPRLQDLGFAVDEVNLQRRRRRPDAAKVAVAARRFHATQLHDLTGLDVGEGQARILLADLHALRVPPAAERSRHLRCHGRAALGGGRDAPGIGAGASGGWAGSATRSRRTATCSRCAGCSASRPSRTSARRRRWRRWPGGPYRPGPRRGWRSPRRRPVSCRPSRRN